MGKVFVSYGSGIYAKSLRRIGKEAKKLGIFSKIVLLTDKDMPPFIQASPLKAYSRGDGYWSWKPYIIWKALQDYPNDIIVYADCGCTLQANMKEWESWFNLLKTYRTLAFQYRSDFKYPWQYSTSSDMTCEQWTKRSMVEYFDPLIGNREWLHSNQIWAGVILVRRSSPLIKMWLDITMFHPELLMDVYGNEFSLQHERFIEHRHDQSLWTALCIYWESKKTIVKIIPETAESDPTAAIVASRIHEMEREPIKTRMIRFAKHVLGESLYRRLRFWRKK